MPVNAGRNLCPRCGARTTKKYLAEKGTCAACAKGGQVVPIAPMTMSQFREFLARNGGRVVYGDVDAPSAVGRAETLEQAEAILRRFAPPARKLERALVREKLKRLLTEKGSRAPTSLIDAWLNDANAAAENVARSAFAGEEPWPDPVDADVLLKEVRESLQRFVVLPSEAAYVVLAVWVLYTYLFDAFDITPYLRFSSPEPESGKTRAMEVLRLFAARALFAGGLSQAVLFRVVDRYRPTLFMDEVDAYEKELAEALRGVLDNGSEKGHPILRWDAENDTEVAFDPYCPKVMAGIGRLSDTVESRSVAIQMRRKAPGEKVERLVRHAREALATDAEAWRRKAIRWTRDNREKVRTTEVEVLDHLGDRQMDAWEPLFATAQVVGGEWPDLLLEASREFSRPTPASESNDPNVFLMRDLRDYLDEHPDDAFCQSHDLIYFLNSHEDRPWMEWRWLNPDSHEQEPGISYHRLARMLRLYGVASERALWLPTRPMGYSAEALRDAVERWTRREQEPA